MRLLRDHRGDLARWIRIRVLEHEPRIRRRLGLRLGDPGPHRLLRLAAHARDECVVEHAPLAQLRLEPPHALTAALLLDAIQVDQLTLTSQAPVRANAQGKYPVPEPGVVTDREYQMANA